MRKSILGLSAIALLSAISTPALAEDAPAAEPFKITGNVALVSDYRFRGFSQSSQNAAIQGGITATHDSGFYVGTWGSSITFAGGTEIDLFAGWSKAITPGVTLDVGLLYYLYPKHGGGDTDFFEPYVNLTGAIGPATLKVGVNYGWSQDALANLKTGVGNSDEIYIHAEPSLAIPGTPFGVNGHLGYASSDAFPGGTDGEVVDWSLGATATYKMLTFGVSYVDTNEPGFIRGSDAAVVFSLTAAF
ncbi:TorF family putative porin [Sphingobium nicotianae]|uniref:TorF family putative porin n=1 Tax=Sphingobium nicotianae TaxID=2782607 RepID=A0A9X1DEP1_9SPHN|nr:TorF family putative porin [Sphingobium nicotianae]MBT2188555.1 TorF family putative porin [Sphingobium nicotianae]